MLDRSDTLSQYAISGIKPLSWIGKPDAIYARLFLPRAWSRAKFWPHSWYEIIWGRGSYMVRQEMWSQGEAAARYLAVPDKLFSWVDLYPRAMADRARKGFVAAAIEEARTIVDCA